MLAARFFLAVLLMFGTSKAPQSICHGNPLQPIISWCLQAFWHFCWLLRTWVWSCFILSSQITFSWCKSFVCAFSQLGSLGNVINILMYTRSRKWPFCFFVLICFVPCLMQPISQHLVMSPQTSPIFQTCTSERKICSRLASLWHTQQTRFFFLMLIQYIYRAK